MVQEKSIHICLFDYLRPSNLSQHYRGERAVLETKKHYEIHSSPFSIAIYNLILKHKKGFILRILLV